MILTSEIIMDNRTWAKRRNTTLSFRKTRVRKEQRTLFGLFLWTVKAVRGGDHE